ncbi:hypothetical protein [Psychroflexus sediminis]|uniref:Uncharacterized protein n=1 Tax=Psychroflexus sediminis TaxID=470826 RepID=A0A1G7XBQ2_9FLAO|nr:hypothetical protein [Psychroflexus sediminis]SDG81487.1 hypothetical protein SAMN04488027_1084 [Psychroflexus sediminis]
MKTNTRFSDKKLSIINFSIVAYFILMWLLYVYQIHFFIIGFLVELLTIPFLIAEVVFLVVGSIHLIKKPIRIVTLVSMLSLGVCAFITFRSLI